MIDSGIPQETLKKLMQNCFPEETTDSTHTNPTTQDIIKITKKLFAQKLKEDDIEEIFESPDMKLADVDTVVDILSKHVEKMSTLELRELLTYKAFPCEKGGSCPRRPPEIVPYNEYMDKCLECPFYHHEKDRRRLFLTFGENDDFAYKANYAKTGDTIAEIESCSKNFFESLFHPIFYKLFACKRKYCEGSYFCPYRHCDKEKAEWDEKFMRLTNKQRDLFLKEKPFLMPHSNGSLNILEDFVPKPSYYESRGI